MKNISIKSEKQAEAKADKFGALDWVILIVCIFMLPGSIMLLIEDGSPLLFFGEIEKLEQIGVDMIWFLLSIKGLRSKFKKLKELKTEKVCKTMMVMTWVVFVFVLASTVFSIYFAFRNNA